MTTTASAQDLTLREPQTDDVEKLAQIVFDAFGSIDYHRFTRDFPQRGSRSRDDQRLGRPPQRGVVAERGGRIVGSNFLDERDPIKVRV